MAGSNDFTGQNIQDTYQRVLQISSSDQIADGTGSLIPFLNVSASYALTASIEITKASIKPDKIPGVSKGNVIVLNAEVLFE